MESTTQTQQSSVSKNELVDIMLRVFLVALLLYLFLVGVSVLGGSFKLMGGGFAKGLLNVTANPILGLFSGMFATVLFQSSSVTTSIIVGLVASSALPLGGAIPMIMGANLGTSVTNTLVSLGYIKNQKHFRDAFAAATVHDIFNILTVVILLPLELSFGFLEKASQLLASSLYGGGADLSFKSPIKAAIKPVAKAIHNTIISFFEGPLAGIVLIIIAAAMIILALGFIVKIMKVVVESNKGHIIENLLSKNGYLAIVFGCLLTIAVQSSSITTSLLVPMAGAGVLTIESILPVTIGANIGTTATALIASLTGNISGLAIALVHFIFNFAGMVLWYMNPTLRKTPIALCNKLADLTLKNRVYGVVYIVGVFFILPFLLTIIL